MSSNSNVITLLREHGFHVNERGDRCSIYWHGTFLFEITRHDKRSDWLYRSQYRTGRGTLKEAQYKANRLDRIQSIKQMRGY